MTAKSNRSVNLTLWGHSLADCQAMFGLKESDLSKKMVDCGSGPSSFNAEMHAQGYDIVSCDELYGLARPDMESYIVDSFQAMLTRLQQHEDCFNWDQITSIDEFAKRRQQGINQFLADFPEGVSKGRYFDSHLTQLPFENFQFEMALCSHHLFGNRAPEDLNSHLQAILEMCRVASEVRIYPIINSDAEVSPLMGELMANLHAQNIGVEIREVPFRFRKNGNAMLRVWIRDCVL